MRYVVVVWILCVIGLAEANAQQKPHYTQYILNQYIINPALTGIENYVDIKLSHRQQWAGIQDAPVTTYFTIQGPLNKSDYRTTATSVEMEGENPRGTSYWENYTAAKPHHGIGMQVINDRTGPFNHFSMYATYAYHIGISPRTSLAAGFGAGFTNSTLNTDKLNWGDPQVDPALYGTGTIRNLKPDFNAGLYLYSADFFAGLSAQQIIPQDLDFSNGADRPVKGRYVPHIFGTLGYRFMVGEDFNLIPSVLVKYLQETPAQFELNAKLQYHDLLWLGSSYRFKDGFAGMAGLRLGKLLSVGYAYDYTTSRLNTISRGTHEIVLGFLLGNKYDDSCPRNVW